MDRNQPIVSANDVSNLRVSVVGLGVLGSAMYKVFKDKNINLNFYDKYKHIHPISAIDDYDIIFICISTPYDDDKKDYNLTEIENILGYLTTINYKNIVAIKSTIGVGTSKKLKNQYNLNIMYNPEFCSADTAEYDIRNQSNIIIGTEYGLNVDTSTVNNLYLFYKYHWRHADISICTFAEAELIKLSLNSFYCVKVQFFNEIYQATKHNGVSYNRVLELMLKNNTINKSHTTVPGKKGMLSYHGSCLPKDVNSMSAYLTRNELPNNVIKSAVDGRNNFLTNIINKDVKKSVSQI